MRHKKRLQSDSAMNHEEVRKALEAAMHVHESIPDGSKYTPKCVKELKVRMRQVAYLFENNEG